MSRERREKMKGYFKYLVLLTLLSMLAIGLVYGMAPVVLIGETEQTVPFESNPTAEDDSGVGVVTNPANMWDGDIDTFGNFRLGSGFGTSGYLELKTFTIPTISPFDPDWVDIKINYKVATATTDDLYRIEYTVGTGNPWIELQPDVGGPDSAFDPAGTFARTWAQAQEPDDGDWSWTDIANLRVRVFCTRVDGWDSMPNRYMDIYEVWVSVYPSPLPPIGSPAVSIQPDDVSAMGLFFIDVYGQDLGWWDPDALVTRGLWGYEVHIHYDTTVLTALNYYSYYPFKTPAPSVIDDSIGLVSVSYNTFAGDTEGFIGNTSLFRVYFKSDSLGLSDLTIAVCKLKPVALLKTEPPTHDGFARTMALMSAVAPGASPPTPPYDPDLIDPSVPLPTEVYWHELWPTYSNLYTQTGFTDNGDGYLSPSDQIEVSDGVTTKEWHVELVTTTIWFDLIDFGIPDVGAEPTEPIYPDPPEPLGNPIGTTWHSVAPPDMYCYEFTITEWDDADSDGVFEVCEYFIADFGPEFGSSMAHLTDISTDIIVTEKPEPVPEFPLGLGLIMALAPAIPIVYLWRTRKKVEKQ